MARPAHRTSRWSLNPALWRHPGWTPPFWPEGWLPSIAAANWCGSDVMGLATRNPTLLFSFVGVLLLRFEERRLFSVLFQLPPRIPRFSDVFRSRMPVL
jgi:hypothetical protein